MASSYRAAVFIAADVEEVLFPQQFYPYQIISSDSIISFP